MTRCMSVPSQEARVLGARASSTTHFSWRSNNASVYKAFTHQHLGEIRASIFSLQSKVPNIHFIPMRELLLVECWRLVLKNR